MLLAQFYSNSTNQPQGTEVPITTALLNRISRVSTFDHAPNSVLSELRQGFAIETLAGFYMARDDGRDWIA